MKQSRLLAQILEEVSNLMLPILSIKLGLHHEGIGMLGSEPKRYGVRKCE
jgi:hypothetical protein